MRLAAFIRANLERIAEEWDRFAASLSPGVEISEPILRDDIVDMLKGIADDMDHAERAEQRAESSPGDVPPSRPIEVAAGRHAQSRLEMGLSPGQLIAEFRALRATVVRLWRSGLLRFDKTAFHDMARFNAALDQVLSDATVTYTEALNRSRDMFLGVLGHDLRNPLAAISGAAELQLHTERADRHAHFASQILVSVGRMSHLITDLIELTRVRLGGGIVIKPALTSMRRICAVAVEEMEAIYPRRVFQLNCDEEIAGEWDEARLCQVLSNLLGNAIQHGDRNSPITVSARAVGGGAELTVHNHGKAIPPEALPKLFDSMFRGGSAEAAESGDANSMGLGLFIAKQIIEAHGGTIDVESSDEQGTSIIARLPLSG